MSPMVFYWYTIIRDPSPLIFISKRSGNSKNFSRSNLSLIFLLAQALLRVTVKNLNRMFVRTNFPLSLRGARNFVANIDRWNSFRVSRFRLSLSPIFLRFIHVRPLKSHFLTQSKLSTTIWYILSKTGGTMYALLRD